LVTPIGGFKRTLEELVQYSKNREYNGYASSNDALVRNKLADIAIQVDVAYMFFWQTAWMLDQGKMPKIEASVLKLFTTTLSQKLAETGMHIMAKYGQLDEGSKWAALNGRFSVGFLDCISALVGAGTSEIQRNIIAIRGLGLPFG